MTKQILITGGAGFVGSHVADGLLRCGHAVRILDNLTPQVHGDGLPDYLSPHVELIRGDVRNAATLRSALAGVDVVFHFAAAVGVGQSMYEISRYVSTNTLGTAELLQAMLDSKRLPEKVIVASSMSIYGEGRYVCSQCQSAQAPTVRTVAQLKAGKWDFACILCGGALQPAGRAFGRRFGGDVLRDLLKRRQSHDECHLKVQLMPLPTGSAAAARGSARNPRA